VRAHAGGIDGSAGVPGAADGDEFRNVGGGGSEPPVGIVAASVSVRRNFTTAVIISSCC
jgi:hypothetical protein